ncbi:hypothetical protein KQI61_17245 [Anaerocolumna aminovalerica]|uniref:hypothetical protein n=1 Tax=Anaerocolumna aminovalerica TaxID=1527 RepID=UPI001C0E971E|nr:hypothetical protein [Anaerocolumna aminovalerica]MBU5333941.1 hypothetical protein [Anaerocolumna aminovalerica]
MIEIIHTLISGSITSASRCGMKWEQSKHKFLTGNLWGCTKLLLLLNGAKAPE